VQKTPSVLEKHLTAFRLKEKTHTTHRKCVEIRINKAMAQITGAYIEKRLANISYKVGVLAI